MKKRNLLWVALVLALIAALAGCDDGFGLPGDAGGVGELVPFTGTRPLTESTALTLLQNGIYYTDLVDSTPNYRTKLGSINSRAFEKALTREKGGYSNLLLWYASLYTANSASVSVEFKPEDSVGELAQITGSSSFNVSSSRPLYGSTPTVGDTYSLSSSINKKVDFLTTPFTSSSYKVSGKITVEANSSTNTTIKAPAVVGGERYYEGSRNSSVKVSAILAVTNGSLAAKYKFSYAENFNQTGRYVEQGNNIILSDIEVYDNNNVLIFKISSYDLSDELASLLYNLNDSPFNM